MKRFVYEYEEGDTKVHTTIISKVTVRREGKGSRKVSIYECNENELDRRLDGESAGKYITTILIK